MLRVMMPGGKFAWFDAVVLNAYKECPAPDQEDRKLYLRQCLQRSLCISTCPPSTQHLQPRTRSACSTLTNSTSSLIFPSQPFTIEFVRLSPPLPNPSSFRSYASPPQTQTQGWVHNSADFLRRNCISLRASKTTYLLAYGLDLGQ